MRAFVTMRNYVASVSAASAELAEFKERLMLIEQSCKDNADAVSDLSEDMQKELDDIYLALSQLADKQKTLKNYKNRKKIGFKQEP
jgi:DNA repair ATPase RecN